MENYKYVPHGHLMTLSALTFTLEKYRHGWGFVLSRMRALLYLAHVSYYYMRLLT